MPEPQLIGDRPDALPLRPDDLLAFRLGRLVLLLSVVPELATSKPMDVERISLYDFFADNPFLIFGRQTAEHETLVLAGFDSRNLSYQSSAQRFSSRRERLQHDLAVLIAFGLVRATTNAGRVTYALTDAGSEHAASFRSLYAQAYRSSAALVGRELNRLSDRALQLQTRQWLRADELLIDLFEPVPPEPKDALVSLRLRALRLLGAGRNYGVDFTVDGASARRSPSSPARSRRERRRYSSSSTTASGLAGIRGILRSSGAFVPRSSRSTSTGRSRSSSAPHSAQSSSQRCIAAGWTRSQRRIRRSDVRSPRQGIPNSLSSFLLAATGLHGVQLKEAPTQPRSSVDPLSFRDLMPLSFLTNQRMDNKNLLLESQFMRNLKLVQVIEILFGVYDDQLAAMSDQLDRLEHERTDLAAEITSLETFLAENGVSGRLELDARSAALKQRLEDARIRLDALNARMQAETAYAADARAEYGRLRRRSGESAARVRDRETLLRRLLPLRGQYAEDERKLVFFREAERLFDPLRMRICPACMQELPSPVEIEAGGTCSLCHQHIPAAPEPVDIAAERTAVRARLQSIDRYIEEVEKQFAEASAAYQARHPRRDCGAEAAR